MTPQTPFPGGPTGPTCNQISGQFTSVAFAPTDISGQWTKYDMSGSVDGNNLSGDSVSQTQSNGVRTENRWRAVLTKPIPSWVIPLGMVVLVVFWLVQGAMRRAEIVAEWETEDRSPIESLNSFREWWSLCDHDTQNAFLESNVRLVQISRDAGISHHPNVSSAVIDLANISVSSFALALDVRGPRCNRKIPAGSPAGEL